MEACGGSLLWNGSEEGAGGLENKNAAGKERALKTRGAGGDEDELRSETFIGCKLDELADTEMKAVDRFVGKGIVREEA